MELHCIYFKQVVYINVHIHGHATVHVIAEIECEVNVVHSYTV